MKLGLTGAAALSLLVLTGTAALAAPITFAAADYDNGAAQTGGLFRDVLNGTRISSGGHLVGGAATGAFTALNFNGADNNGPYRGATTLYDTNVSDGLATMFTGNISLSADVLVDPFNNAKGAGIVFLFNEGAGNGGLALYLWNAGTSDSYAMNFMNQEGVSRPGNVAATQALGSNIPEDQWFRLTLDLLFTSPTAFTATGKVFSHVTATDPTSALGSQVGTNLVYSSTLSSVLLSPYEIGLVGRGDSATEGASITNFSIDSSQSLNAAAVPEPASLLLLGTGLVWLAKYRRRRQNAR